MRPIEYRNKALTQIEAAKALLNTSPEIAWYTAGYAIEFMLKARLCIARGWARFPSSPKELKQWNHKAGISTDEKIFIHDLDQLLMISDTLRLKTSSYLKIDWTSACSWNEQIRYKPNGVISKDEAAAYIDEIESAVKQLHIIELIASCLEIEKHLTNKYGLFHCFAIVEHPNKANWMLVSSWVAKDSDSNIQREEELSNKLDFDLDNDLRKMIASIEFLHPLHPLMQGLYVMINTFTGPILHHPAAIFSHNDVVGYPTFPPGYILSAGFWSDEALRTSWKDS